MISNSIEEEINAVGSAQVIVVLTPLVQTGIPTNAAFAAAIPVTASRSGILLSSKVVAQVAAQFCFGESTQAVAMAASRGFAASRSAGAKWFRSAAATNNPTPQARIYPNLGVMLGRVDKTGLKSLRQDQGVKDVLLAPRLSLIRPVRVGPAAASAAVANQKTRGIKRLGEPGAILSLLDNLRPILLLQGEQKRTLLIPTESIAPVTESAVRATTENPEGPEHK